MDNILIINTECENVGGLITFFNKYKIIDNNYRVSDRDMFTIERHANNIHITLYGVEPNDVIILYNFIHKAITYKGNWHHKTDNIISLD